MTPRDLVEQLQNVHADNVHDFYSRTVRVSAGGMTGAVARLDWRYGDLVLVAETAEPEAEARKRGRAAGTGIDGMTREG